jgi:COP9 signalosome complex subunit 7
MESGSKIEQFVLLAKGARGRGLTELITRATAEAGVFGFGELLDVPSVKEVSARS